MIHRRGPEDAEETFLILLCVLCVFQPACGWEESQRHISRQDCRLASLEARPTGGPKSSRAAKKVVVSTAEDAEETFLILLCVLCASAVSPPDFTASVPPR
jgi:hypothetical protein